MSSTWSQFVQNSAPSEQHGARVYADVAELAQSVGTYLAAGFDRGEPAVVIVTREHWRHIAVRLALGGWNEQALEEEGLLWQADADQTLASIMVDGTPSPERFAQVVGALMDRVEKRLPDRRIRAFGEMVDLLCQRGDAKSAAALEDLWNALAQQRAFSLLCGYRLDVFDRLTQASILPEVCRSHSHVQAAEDPVRLQRAVDSALDEALGADAGKVYALMSNRRGQTSAVPTAQLALMWVSAEMPAHAERILASARTKYREMDGPGRN